VDYVWRQAGAGPEARAAGYYIPAAASGAEPPGRWWGPAAEALGLAAGQLVEREPYDVLFREHKGSDGTPLSRRPGGSRLAADLYGQLLAAEPHATSERRRELRVRRPGGCGGVRCIST
jgi:hypothetical protein